MTPASVMKRFKANGASIASDFQRVSLKMALLLLCRITNVSTETESCYKRLNRELRWLWNSVYIFMSVSIAERPTFEKELFTLIEVCLQTYFFSSYIHFEGRILNLIVAVNGHCISY